MINIISLKDSPVTDSEIKEIVVNLEGIEYVGLIMPKVKLEKEKLENGK